MYIDISPGTDSMVYVKDGDVIEGIPAREFTEDLDVMVASAKGLLKNLEVIMAKEV